MQHKTPNELFAIAKTLDVRLTNTSVVLSAEERISGNYVFLSELQKKAEESDDMLSLWALGLAVHASDMSKEYEVTLQHELAYEKQLEFASKVLGKLHPIGDVKCIGYLEIDAALRECLDMAIEALDPESLLRQVSRLRDRLIAAKAAISQQ